MRRWTVAASAVVLSLACAGAYSNYFIRDGNGATQTVESDSVGGVIQPVSSPVDANGNHLATAPGAANTNAALPIQGVSGGVPIPVATSALPLPSGAATAAKQPAPGTAGSPSADVISVQGAAGGTPLPVANAGASVNPSVTPTIQAAAYISGNCMGGFQAVSVARAAGVGGLINRFTFVSKSGSTLPVQIYLFDSNPASSTCTDKGTFSIAAADAGKLISSFSVTPAALIGTTITEAEIANLGAQFTTSGNANVYAAIVAGANQTPASTADFVFRLGATQD